MPLFKYLAAAPGARPSEVQIEADSPAEALNKLRSRKLTAVRFYGEAEAPRAAWWKRGPRIDTYEFTSELAPLLAANIPLERALGIIAEGCTREEQKNFVVSLRQGLHEGKKFSDLVRAYGRVFPGFYANLLESGEESGCLPEVVSELLRFMEEAKETREFIISSSIYPSVVFGITILVSVLMFVVFIPRFAQLFTDMGREQPESMQFLLSISSVMSWAWWGIPLAAYLAWKIACRHYGQERVREWRSRKLLDLPIFGKLFVELELARFVRTMAILIGNHVEIIRTVRISIRVLQNQTLRASFQSLERSLKGGHKLSEGLAGNPFLPVGLVSKLRVGEESGTVGNMLEHTAGQLAAQSRRKIKRLLSMFEPLVIVFLALIVLVVVVSIFMAIMEINSAE